MYKVEHFIISSYIPKSKSKTRCTLCSSSYINMDMINLPSIFRNLEFTSLLPRGLNVKVLTVCFYNESSISKHLLNHSIFSKNC